MEFKVTVPDPDMIPTCLNADCNEVIINTSAFCGYCGTRNMLFDPDLYRGSYGRSIEQARREYCTELFHRMRADQINQLPSVLPIRSVPQMPHLIFTFKKERFCHLCGLELFEDPNKVRARRTTKWLADPNNHCDVCDGVIHRWQRYCYFCGSEHPRFDRENFILTVGDTPEKLQHELCREKAHQELADLISEVESTASYCAHCGEHINNM